MLTRIQQDLEDDIYKKLKEGGFDAKMVVTKYHKQSIEELASIFTKEMMRSWVGGVINNLPPLPGHDFVAICRGAFKGAMLRILTEADGSI